MPKAPPEDHRPIRACLSAPYPLPFIITTRHSASPTPLGKAQHPSAFENTPFSTTCGPSGVRLPTEAPPPISPPKEPANNFFCYDFPTVNLDWKDIEPPYPPIPYPPRDSEEIIRKRARRLRLLKEVKGNSESSEWDIITRSGGSYVGKDKGTVEDLDEEMQMLKTINEIAMVPVGGGDNVGINGPYDTSSGRNNLLRYAFLATVTKDDSVSPPSKGSRTATQAYPVPNTTPEDPKTNGGPNLIPVSVPSKAQSLLPDADHDLYAEKSMQKGPGWDVISAASSFCNEESKAEEADEECYDESPTSARLVTPAAALRRIRRPRKVAKALSLGLTNQSPSTYFPPPKLLHQAQQSSIGDSDITSRPAPHALFDAMGGYGSESGSTRTVTQIKRGRWSRMGRRTDDLDMMNHGVTTVLSSSGQAYLVQPTHQPRSLDLSTPTFNPTNQLEPSSALQLGDAQQSMLGFERFSFGPLAPLHHPSKFLSGPSFSSAEKRSNRRLSPNEQEQWSSLQPISIDPRTAEASGGTSWPHPLPEREQAPSNGGTLRLASLAPEGQVDVPMPTASTAAQGISFGKTCHNFLFRRKEAARRKKERMRKMGKDKDKDKRLRLLMPPPPVSMQFQQTHAQQEALMRQQQGYTQNFQWFNAQPIWDGNSQQFMQQLPPQTQIPQGYLHIQPNWMPVQQMLMQPVRQSQQLQYFPYQRTIKGQTLQGYPQTLGQISVPIRSLATSQEGRPLRKRRRSLSPSSAYDFLPIHRPSFQVPGAPQAHNTLLPPLKIISRLAGPSSKLTRATKHDDEQENGGELWDAALQNGDESMDEEERKRMRRDKWVEEERDRMRAMNREKSAFN